MKKEAVVRVISKIPGFRKKGSFFIGTCNDDIISGYSVDAPPSHTYVWRFILPSYDKCDFLHMALGKRVVSLPRTDESQNGLDAGSLRDLLIKDWNYFKDVKDSGDIIPYIESEKLEGDYVVWTRYLTYIRQGKFEEAEVLGNALENDSNFPRVALVANNLKPLSDVISSAGWDGAQRLLAEWAHETTAAFC